MAGRRLKVFQAQFGFYDTVVAAPSQAAALRAWGTHQNLFAGGDARPVTDEAAVAAALRHPETPLRRPVGSDAPFVLEPVGLPKAPDLPKAKPAAAKAARPAKPPADRSALDAAEAALHGLDEARKAEEAELRRQRDALDAEMTTAQNAYVAARKAAAAALAEARDAYRKARGEG